jgi:hypothetical protein
VGLDFQRAMCFDSAEKRQEGKGETMQVDRRNFLASLGGAAAVSAMTSEAKAEALESYMMQQLNTPASPSKFPKVADLEAQIETRSYRRGVGNLFLTTQTGGKVKKLQPMPAKPTLPDFFKLRFSATSNHVLQSANLALKHRVSEEIILACLLHDVVQELIKVDHGYWGAQMFEPYVPEKTSFAIRYHQALRFYEDKEAGYVYPDLYRNVFGEDYVPAPHIQAAYKMLRNHKWYMEPRLVTVNDLYAFEAGVVVTLDPFLDIIGRHFKQPKEGLGNDDSPVAHMWRAISNPDSPL